MSINKLLKPEKIVVIGASEKEGFGGDTCRNTIEIMDKGRYYFVNPKRDEVFGEKSYHSVLDLPEKIDLAVICTPMKTVEGLIVDSAKMGANGAVVFASGYGEVGTKEGKEAEASLKKLCEKHGVSLMGPNCAGFINYIDKVSSFAFISNKRDRSGKVGFVSQSGQLVLSMMDRPGTGFSYVISSGNSKIVTMEDYLNFLVDDEDTKVIAMYLEGVKNHGEFIKALDKANRIKKPIVILKSGKSEKAQQIAASHTGSLSGSDKIFDALFEKYGVIRVDDLEELISTSQAIATLGNMPKGNKLASISLSGGETGICADLGEINGIEYGSLSAETMKALKNTIPPYASPNNPLDITASLSYDIDKFATVLEILMKDPNVDMVSVGYTLLDEIADNAIYYMYEAMKRVSKEDWVKPMVMVPFAEMSRNVDYVDKLKAINVPVLPSAQYAFKIISNLLKKSAYSYSDNEFINLNSKAFDFGKTGEKISLSEYESKNFLSERGIKIDPCRLAKSEEEAVQIFNEIKKKSGNKNAKVVAKVDSKDILHKSDMGGVILNLTTEDEVRNAYNTIIMRARGKCPDAKINGVQIAMMSKGGVEIIIGVKNDRQFGPSILCGLGGVFVEIFKDVSLKIAPISKKEGVEMIKSLKAFKLLNGYRGSKACDIDSLADLLVKISEIAIEEKDKLLELDINPVFVNEEGVSVADALVVLNR